MQRKKIRLDRGIYNEPGRIFSITICLKDRKTLFAESKLTKEFVPVLNSLTQKAKVAVYAFCFMPDHLHVLVDVPEEIGLVDLVREFKGRSTKVAWGCGYEGTIWQRSFYDHCLRKDEEVKVVASYILNNPVRAGLVEKWRDYPYSGSWVWNLDEL
ncbi:MAG: transposase [bacterium]|nr:transposase [bacterium]